MDATLIKRFCTAICLLFLLVALGCVDSNSNEGGDDPSIITVKSPNGGESWQADSTNSITWSSSNTGSYVKVELFKGGSFDSIITSSTLNNSSYSWTIPTSINAGSDYKIKISDTYDSSIYDDSDGYFTASNRFNNTLEVYLYNSNNRLSGFQGDTFSEEIRVIGIDGSTETTDFSYSVSGLQGIIIDDNGNLSYTIPDNSPSGVLNDFDIIATHKSTGKTGLFSGSVYVMEKVILGSGIVGSGGGTVSSDSGSIVFSVSQNVLSENTNISINRGCDTLGNPEISIMSDVTFVGEFDISLPSPEELLQESNCSTEVSQSSSSSLSLNVTEQNISAAEIECDNSTWGIFQHVWQCNKKYYTKLKNFRIDYFSLVKAVPETCISSSGFFCIKVKAGSLLLGSDPSDDVSSEKQPVLFIHGYKPVNLLGGGNGTWAQFPELLEKNGEYLPFEFRWRTNARFQDVAEDLVYALELIKVKTGKKVHIVAHSFGGILARTVLQKLNATDGTSYVASLITLGTPHSGIFESDTEMDGVTFMKGQDSWSHGLCGQISCYQMGEYVVFESIKSLLGIGANHGEIVANLAKTNDTDNPLPSNLPIKAAIGLIVDENGNVRNGDGLVSYNGQRFHPDLTNSGTTLLLLSDETDYSGKITETILNTSDKGYKHSSWSFPLGTPTEAGVSSTEHASFKLVSEWLRKNFIFSETFESGSLASYWQTNSTNSGRIQVTSLNSPNSGSYHLTMDSSVNGTSSLNELILSINLASQSDIVLSFYHKEYSDENNSMSNSFIGSENSDGVAVSVDGANWYKAQGLTSTELIASSYKLFYVDLDTIFLNNDLSYTDPVYIKFQQYDNYGITTDGFAFDDIELKSMNIPPIANAGSDQNVITGSTVTLDGSGSSGSSLVYDWSFVSKPSGSSVSLSDSTLVNPTFIVDVDGNYVIQLVVNDGTVDSIVDTVLIIAKTPPPSITAKVGSGTLAGSSLSTTNPTITVSSGGSITGSVVLNIHNELASGSVVPLCGSPNWGTPSNSYWTINSWVGTGDRTVTATLSLTAPSITGTYYLLFVASGSYNCGQIMSGTHPAYSADWTNGNVLANLSDSQLNTANENTGYISGYSWYTPSGNTAPDNLALTTVKVVVSNP